MELLDSYPYTFYIQKLSILHLKNIYHRNRRDFRVQWVWRVPKEWPLTRRRQFLHKCRHRGRHDGHLPEYASVRTFSQSRWICLCLFRELALHLLQKYKVKIVLVFVTRDNIRGQIYQHEKKNMGTCMRQGTDKREIHKPGEIKENCGCAYQTFRKAEAL